MKGRARSSSRITPNGDGTASVELTQGKVAIVDLADVPLIQEYKWYAVKATNTFYARTQERDKAKTTLTIHGLIAGSKNVDHIDRDGLNNRRSNLRLADGTIQKLNQNTRKDNTSGTSGVHLRPWGEWQARIAVKGERVSLGHFSTFEDASRCIKACRKIIDKMLCDVAPSIDKKGDD